MNDIDLDTRLREQLPRLADFAVGASEPTTPLADVQLLEPARRPRWKVAAAVGIAAAALVVGGVVIVDALRSPAMHRAPVGISSEPPPVNTLTIEASNFHFDQLEYHAPPGLNEIRFTSSEGSHTLTFADPRFADVVLEAASGTSGGGSVPYTGSNARVTLEAGRTYVVYCQLPGHRQAGMESRIVVDGPTTSTTTAP
jgi:plastocyanin